MRLKLFQIQYRMQDVKLMLTTPLQNLIIISLSINTSAPASTTVAPSHSSIPPSNCLPFLSIPLSFLSCSLVSFSSADLDLSSLTNALSLSTPSLSERSPPTQCTLSRLKINTRSECLALCVFLPCVYMNVYEVMCVSQHSVCLGMCPVCVLGGDYIAFTVVVK